MGSTSADVARRRPEDFSRFLDRAEKGKGEGGKAIASHLMIHKQASESARQSINQSIALKNKNKKKIYTAGQISSRRKGKERKGKAKRVKSRKRMNLNCDRGKERKKENIFYIQSERQTSFLSLSLSSPSEAIQRLREWGALRPGRLRLRVQYGHVSV